MARNVGDKVIFNGKEVTIIEKHKGAKTTKRVMHSGILFNGYASAPCTYTLSSGQRVQGNLLKRSI